MLAQHKKDSRSKAGNCFLSSNWSLLVLLVDDETGHRTLAARMQVPTDQDRNIHTHRHSGRRENETRRGCKYQRRIRGRKDTLAPKNKKERDVNVCEDGEKMGGKAVCKMWQMRVICWL